MRGLEAFNTRHPWSHNDHFHGWILRHLPENRGRAVDIGCGRGLLISRLASHFDQVEGADLDAAMRSAASERVARLSNVTISDAQLEDLEPGIDLITMVAVLHHLDLERTLELVEQKLALGGKLLVVGLARPETAADIVWDLACAATNPVIGLAKHPRPHRGPKPGEQFPVKDPELTLADIRAAVASTLPGARVRRRLGFRHTIEWTKL